MVSFSEANLEIISMVGAAVISILSVLSVVFFIYLKPQYSIRTLFLAALVAGIGFAIYRLASDKLVIIGYVMSLFLFMTLFFLPAFLVGIVLNLLIGKRTVLHASDHSVLEVSQVSKVNQDTSTKSTDKETAD